MSVLTVPRSIASSFLKNFSINFTATVPPPYWQVPWKRVSFQSATRMPELRPVISWGMSFENNKQLLTGGFQRRMRFVRARRETYDFDAVRLMGPRMNTDENPDCHPYNPWLLRHEAQQFVQCGGRVVAEVDADDATTALHEGAEVPECLGLFQNREGVGLAGDRKVDCIISDALEEHTRVRSPFVKLSGRVQETRTIADRHRAVRLITQLHAKLLKLLIGFRSL